MAAAKISVSRADSVDPVKVTQSAAIAFGDDIADDSYSVSELSHYHEDDKKSGSRKQGRKPSKGKRGGDNFTKAKLSLLQKRDSESAPVPGESDDNAFDNGTSDPYGRRTSSSSNDPSDDVWNERGAANETGDITRRNQKRTGSVDSESEDSDPYATSTFTSFALTRFQARMPPVYVCSALPHPLLPQPDRADYLAALASWVTILRIMGDLPDVDTGHSIVVTGSGTPLTSRVKQGFKFRYTKRDVEEAHIKYSELFKDPTGVDTRTLPFMPLQADTMLDKVQLVCALGIYRTSLRDELYCQLCKQLTNNPSRNSNVRGWVLMSLFAGSFTPSERFAPSLTSFLRDGPPEFSEKVDRVLRRTCSIGTRGYPASWLEFQAAKNGKPLLIPVTFMNGHRLLCEVDAATTVCEVIQNICDRLGIQDSTGFSLYIALHSRISCLGNGQHRVMDAISECEQHTKQMGHKESHSGWRIFFRREFFAPWYRPGLDPISTDLDYQQIKRGLAMGEYKTDSDAALVTPAARMFYIDNPEDGDFNNIIPYMTTLLPEDQEVSDRVADVSEKVKAECISLKLFSSKPDLNIVKADVVQHARDKYYTLFSRYHEASKAVMPELTLQDVIVAVNSRGIYVLDSQDKARLHAHFAEIIASAKSKHHLTLTLASLGDVVLNTPQAEEIYNLVNFLLDGVKSDATVAIARQDVTHLDGPADSNLVRGDVVRLAEPISEETLHSGDTSVSVTCLRTGKRCDVPANILYMVAPEVAMPPVDVLERLSHHIKKSSSSSNPTQGRNAHSLQQYAKINFRPSGESTMTKLFNKASLKRREVEHLWSFSRDALKKPLLKKTISRDDIRKLACHCFTSIQTYMTNLVINDEVTNYNLASDWILTPARRNKYLRDEIYCQIIKQLTNNPDQSSANRGWVLLALLTSLTAPTKELLAECLLFCQGSAHTLARQCERSLKRQRTRGGCRLYTSHYLEHEMVSKQQPNIRVQVYLPNQSCQTLEINSHTQVFDMKREVASRLHLKSINEYAIFLSSNERVFCLSDKSFYFDCLRHAEVYWFKAGRRNSAQKLNSGPMVVMLKKIWVNGEPSQDPVADQVFHFCQEMPNYIRGYHDHSSDKVHRLAALVFRAQFGADDSQLSKFREISTKILPLGYLETAREAEVQKAIQAQLAEIKGMTSAEAKEAFLRELSRLETYGSVFFEVKQRYVRSLPKYCLIAINYLGVHIIDQKTKELVKTYEFHSVPNWAFDDTSFTFIISEGGTWKLLVETNVGHNMDDLMMSYVAWIMNYQMRKKHGFVGTPGGESIC